jgi:hypothetical protein
MLKWIKSRLSKEDDAGAFEVAPDEVEENYSPVGVRVRAAAPARVLPADTYIAGYNVDEAEFSSDDIFATTVNDINTTGVNPYDTGFIDQAVAGKPVTDKKVR